MAVHKKTHRIWINTHAFYKLACFLVKFVEIVSLGTSYSNIESLTDRTKFFPSELKKESELRLKTFDIVENLITIIIFQPSLRF